MKPNPAKRCPIGRPVQIYPQPCGNGGARQAVGSQQDNARSQRQRLRLLVSPHQSLELIAVDLRRSNHTALPWGIPTSCRKVSLTEISPSGH